MTIENEFYVLIKLNKNRKDCTPVEETRTCFLCETSREKSESECFTESIKSAERYGNRTTALLIKQEYERNHTKCEESGLTPILVTEKITW